MINHSPITGKTKKTNCAKNFNSLLDIISKQTSFFENINLPLCGYGLSVYRNTINKKCPAGYANLTGSGRDLLLQR